MSVRATIDNSLAAHIAETRDKHSATPYFARAEALFPQQWTRFIEPAIVRPGIDFSNVLELACGHGRNTTRLLDFVARADGRITLVDVNQHCLDACRVRFAGDQRAVAEDGSPRLRYVLGDGHSLREVESGSVTFIYSWDSMVHFHRDLMERYIHEFARVLVPGGRGFVHHSNYGAYPTDAASNFTDNPHWRSTMTAELFLQYAAAAGLRLLSQRIIDWGENTGIDCISEFANHPQNPRIAIRGFSV